MKPSQQFYLALNCPIMLRGFKSLLNSFFEHSSNIGITTFNSFSEIISTNFPNESCHLLVLDSSLIGNSEQKLFSNFLCQNPELKTIILTSKFKLKKIRFLFNIGVNSVMDKNENPNDILKMIERTIRGEKSLSEKYSQLVLDDFCKTVKNPVIDSVTESVSPDSKDYLDHLFSLSRREKEVLSHICEGLSTKEISENLFISQNTVETHRRNLLAKLNVRNTAQMVKVAILNSLILLETN